MAHKDKNEKGRTSFLLLKTLIMFLYILTLVWNQYQAKTSSTDHIKISSPLLISQNSTKLLNPNTNVRKSSVINIKCLSKSGSASWLTCILILSGDLETNPGPRSFKYPCGVCSRPCKSNQPSIQCDSCETWIHKKCMAMTAQIYEILGNSSISWHCCNCGLPNFNSSLFLDFNDPSTHSSNPFSSLNQTENNASFGSPSRSSEREFNPEFRPQQSSTPNRPSLKVSKDPPFDKNPKVTSLVINFRSVKNKIPHFSALVAETEPDIIFGTETWLNPDIKNSELLIGNYDIFRNDRPNPKFNLTKENETEESKEAGGGVMLCVKKCLNAQLISKSKLSESIFCKINHKKGKPPVILGCVYRPPDADLNSCENITNEIKSIKGKHKKSVLFLGGDFNLPDINWETLSICGHQYLKSINEIFLDLFQDLGLSQSVLEPTRENSILDILLTNNPNLIKSTKIISGVADHDTVLSEFLFTLPRKKTVKRLIRLWNKADLNALKSDARCFSNNFLNSFDQNGNVEDMWSSFKSNLIKILNKHVPTKISSSKFNQPWITTQVKRAIRQKQRWFNKCKHNNSERIHKKYKEIKKYTQKICRNAHFNYVQNLISTDTNNKKLYSYIKSKKQENTGIADIQHGNNLIQDPKTKANLFNDHFCQVFSKPDPSPNPTNNIKPINNSMSKITVNRFGVLKLLNNINENKATGPDEIPGRLLKTCANEICDVLTLMYQSSLDQGCIPNDWKKANIVPVYKKGNKNEIINYRPISLTPITSKILEHIVHSNIMNFFEGNNILNNYQHGFRKKRSCVTQLITTLSDFANCLNNKKQIDSVILDFSKAFDKVDHVQLLSKLDKYGIRNNTHHWISSFLTSREQSVLVEGESSLPAPVTSGVPQGTVLGPLLFLVYINDISDNLTFGTFIRILADDCFLYRVINSALDQEILQNDLNILQNWESNNKMEFHPDKCKVLKITNKLNHFQCSYNIHNTILEEVNSAKYLGITIDKNLNWNDHCLAITKKANSTLAFIQRNLYSCPQNVKSVCYQTLVRPTLEYGCAVWDPHQQNQIDLIEKVQKRAARFVTNNYTLIKGNSDRNLATLGWIPLRERRARIKVTLIFKAINGLIDIPIHDLLSRKIHTRTKTSNLILPQSTINSHLYSFYPDTIRLWNSLPQSIKLSPTLSAFKSSVCDNSTTCPTLRETN